MNVDFSNILDNLNDGLYLVDRNRRITFWNKAAERITGFMRAEVLGRCCSDNILLHIDCDGHDLCQGHCPLAATIDDAESREASIFLHHKQGHRIPVEVRITPLKDTAGQYVGGCEMFSVSRPQAELQQKLAELEKLAFVDSLTGLVNRRFLDLELAGQFALWTRSNISFGVIYFDIDHFKHFNDEYGHHIGDQALQVFARTLTATVRPFDTIGRLGGDEFIGIFPNTTAELLLAMANRFCMLVRKSRVLTEQGPTRITTSLGGTTPLPDDTLESMLQRADAMMFRSKQNGRDQATVG